ncbi:hypothetical protein MBLNU230_g2981t1 [Neophaeotheca triangularis]
MGQSYSQAALPAGPTAIETPELADVTFEKPHAGVRFLRTVRARHQNGIVLVKVCMKSGPNVSFKDYVQRLKDERDRLADVSNALSYQRILETNSIGILVRQYLYTTLYDRTSLRPHLVGIEKKWIAFQLLCAVRDCHARGVFHGDIKARNIVVTSWGWVFLTDFSSAYKPVYLPEDNPADFTFFYDTSGSSSTRTCNVAPERFLAAGQKPLKEEDEVSWSMDIFSLGCVIAELYTEVAPFDLTQMFKFRRGEYDPTLALLNKVDDVHIRALIGSMLKLDPEGRWHAQDYLDEYKDKAFPLYFYQHLHALMQDITDPTAGRKPVILSESNNGEADDRIDRIYQDFEMLSVSLGYIDPVALNPKTVKEPSHSTGLFPLEVDIPNHRHSATSSLTEDGDNGTFILANMVTSSLRSTARAATRIRACELLLAFAERLPDEAKLDRILPYVMPLLDDPNEMVLVAALRTMTQVLALVTVTSPSNSYLFTLYIFPKLQTFVASPGFKKNPVVRATYAACLASLAQSASRFLDMVQALRAAGSLPSEASPDDEGTMLMYQESYDAARAELFDQFEGQTKVFLTDNNTSVRRAFLSSVTSLCVFFGETKSSDIILAHLNTYLNDPDWLLKCAFFETIVGVAIYIGGASLEEFILPLMLQALADPQDFVIEQALRSLSSMAQLGLLHRQKIWELIDIVARFEMHPNVWIRGAAAHFVAASTTFMSVADVRILIAPLLQPYLKVPVSDLTEFELLDALKKPLPRNVLDMALVWANRSDKGVFWKPAKEARQLSYRATGQTIPFSSVADLSSGSMARTPKNDEDEQWLGRLRTAGMRTEDELKLLAFREYIWRAAQRSKRDQPAVEESEYDGVIHLSKLGAKLQTVIFDNEPDQYERYVSARDQDHERSIAEALHEAQGTHKRREGGSSELNGDAAVGTQDARSAQNAGDLKSPSLEAPSTQKRGSGTSLSISPNAGISLLKDRVRTVREKNSDKGLTLGAELKGKASAEVATDDATAAGRVSTPLAGNSRKPSPAAGDETKRKQLDRTASARAIHNYQGNDPTVLKLLDTVYVDSFALDSAEFGPIIQPIKRGPIPSGGSVASKGAWRPQGQLVAILAEHADKVVKIVVPVDHSFFLTASEDGSVRVWDSARLERNITHRSRQSYRHGPNVKITSLSLVESTHTFISTGSDGSVHVVKVDMSDNGTSTRYGKLRTLREWQIPTSSSAGEYAVWSEHFRGDPASTLLLATSHSRILAVDLRYMTILFELQNPVQHGIPTCFCTSRKHDWLLIGTSHGILDLWDLRFKLKLRSWTFPAAAPITRLQLHPSKRHSRHNKVCISGGTARGEVTMWDIEKLICHEIYRPSRSTNTTAEPLHLRNYELHNLDDDRGESLLNRITASTSTIDADATSTTPAVTTAMHFGVYYTPSDTESQHPYCLSGGPDHKLRFWDCESLANCCLISPGGEATPAKPPSTATYTFNAIGTDTKVFTERFNNSDEIGEGSGKAAAGVGGAGKGVTRAETIRGSARGLLSGHLDAISDVGVLERPFGMVLSADRSGRVFVFQ